MIATGFRGPLYPSYPRHRQDGGAVSIVLSFMRNKHRLMIKYFHLKIFKLIVSAEKRFNSTNGIKLNSDLIWKNMNDEEKFFWNNEYMI